MTTVKIYKVTCTKSIMMASQGTGFSLSEWGSNYDISWFDGYDDGGKNYKLPDGYNLGTIDAGQPAIFDQNNKYCDLVTHDCGRPQLISTSNHMPVLKLI